MRKTGWAVSSGIEPAGVKELHQSDSGPVSQQCDDEQARPDASLTGGVRTLKAGLRIAVALCLVTALVHVVLVFLHVAPSNPVSKRYNSQVNGWVYPLFEQNWRLFAPDPDSFNRKILARTAHTDSKGSVRVTPWLDLAAVDHSAVDHNVFPSHTSQNLLRRAWTSYVETHGGSDTARSERAVMLQQYLRNIAADRVTARNDGGTVEFIQLRVVTLPVAAPGAAAGNRPPAPTEDRLLPWWKVTPHGK
ncbi:hypothetical protein KPP03845_100261 [Streptomyces xanthophaeus]|uniref:DUF5819 family protein n=1 Tax=Streptomyces xanthophaeus TaxID=67385 RepID=UPI00233F7A6A|nr:DUF5819 family protein [Streptomyces xanthophaeus]WCD83942.1 hypothetical protein KPP03845_100261 [Streptomyces xanthophaeus]